MVTLIWLLCACDSAKDAPETGDVQPDTSADADTDSDTDSDTDTDSDAETGADTDTAPADADGDGHLAPADCDNADARIHPGAPDGCDALDQDCDGEAQPEGSCGEMVPMADGAAGWWSGAGRLGHLFIAEATTDYTGDRVVDPLASLFCNGEYGCGGTLALLPGRVPGVDEDWTASGGPSWTADGAWEYAYFPGGDAGDFDGDGSRDLFVATLGCPPYAGSLYMLLGPTARWGSGGRYLRDGADGWWEQHQPDDCFGESASAGYDVDGDGRDDVLVETQGNPDGLEGAALSFVAGRGGPLPMGASMNDEVWFEDDISMASYALLPDMDGDGAGEAAVSLTGADGVLRTVAFFAPDVLGSGAAGASLGEALEPLPAREWRGYSLLRGRSGVGDANGDGYADIALQPWWATGGGEYQVCFAHLFGAADLRASSLDDRLGGFACFEGVRGDHAITRVGGDLDQDGIADVLYNVPDFGDAEYAACVIPSSRHPDAGWALMDEVRPYCFGSSDVDEGPAYGGVADLDGDGLPEVLGSEVWWTNPDRPDEEMAGRILVMPGFEVPWADDSRW